MSTNGDAPELMRVKEKTSLIECPHCQTLIRLKTEMSLALKAVTKDEGDDAPPEEWRKVLNPEQVAMLEGVKANGTLEAFAVVTREVKHDQTPRNMERFFFNWLKLVKPAVIPEHALTYFIQQYKQARIEFWQNQGIGCVIADRTMKRFVPAHLVTGTIVQGINGKTNRRTSSGKEELNEWWVRTRYGFVASKGALLETMRVKSIGEFARPVL